MKINALWEYVTAVMIAASWIHAGTTGKLAGAVRDAETGEPLVGCNIIVEGTDLGAATDLTGAYVILNVPPGIYAVRASMIGYTDMSVHNVQVSVDLTTTLDFELTVEILGGEEVTVVAERPAVRMDLTSSESRVSSQELEVMPVTEVWDVLQLQSGITKDAGGGIHIRGGRSGEIAYWVDGIPMTDVYDGGLAVAVENNAIQELQVVSGTFNAEYGQAMSGIINMVTKDGGQDLSGSVTAYSGTFASADTIYRGLDRLDLGNERNLEASFGGPIPFLGNRGFFYVSARHYRNDGYLNGLSAYSMYGDTLADPEIVPMNWREKVTTNSKLTFRPTTKLKVRLGILTSDEEYKNYSHQMQLAPAGTPFNFNTGRTVSLGLTHTLSSRTFYTLNLSQFSREFKQYRFESPTDPRYVDPDYFAHLQTVNPVYSLSTWGVHMGRFQRRSLTEVVKFDLTSQINRLHQVKAGTELRLHELTLDGYAIQDSSEADDVFTIEIPDPDGFNRSRYDVRPREFSAYLQDKLEFKSVILNVGIRWDWFDARGSIPTNPAEPYISNPRNPALDSLRHLSDSLYSDTRLLDDIDWTGYADYYAPLLPDSGQSLVGARGWWTPTTPKQQISPRFGIAYPITDRGVVHFSFGHFFQVPTFNRLYDNPGYKIPETSGRFGIYPNPDLKPQKTVMYELGLKQALTPEFSIDVTGFYRDVRDWVSTGIPIDLGGGASYFTYVNKDYSNVRGVVINIDKRYGNSYAFSLSYTFQVAEGSNSDPTEEFGAVLANREPPRSIIPLDWDQRHTVNGNVFVGTDTWGGTLLGRFGSGYPYTPAIVVSSVQGQNLSTQLVKNSRRKSATLTFDLRLFYRLPVPGARLQAFVNVYNLFDRRNENIVWGDTGRANKTLLEPEPDDPRQFEEGRPNTIREYFTHPEWYLPPRQVQAGINVSF